MKAYTHKSWQVAREEISKMIAEKDRENAEKFKEMLQQAITAKDEIMAQELRRQNEEAKKELKAFYDANEKARKEDQKQQAQVIEEFERRHRSEIQQERERQTQLLEEERRKRQEMMQQREEERREEKKRKNLEKIQDDTQEGTEFDFIAPCPVAGCSNSRVGAIHWRHEKCGGTTKVSTAGYIRCVKCSQSGIILDWLFKCEQHEYRRLSFQGLIYALGVMCQLQNITEDVLEIIVDSIQKQKKEKNYQF